MPLALTSPFWSAAWVLPAIRDAVGFVFFGDGTGAGNYVFQVGHAFEAHSEFAQGGWADVVAEHLANEAHDQHTVRDDAASADQFADFGVGMQRVEVTGRAA